MLVNNKNTINRQTNTLTVTQETRKGSNVERWKSIVMDFR